MKETNELKIQTTNGQLIIDENVIATIVGQSAIATPGISRMCAKEFKDTLLKIVNKERVSTGIKVFTENNKIYLEVYIVAIYGINLVELSKNLSELIKSEVKIITNLEISNISITIKDIDIELDKDNK